MLLSSRPRRLAVVTGLCAGIIGAGATAALLAVTDTAGAAEDIGLAIETAQALELIERAAH